MVSGDMCETIKSVLKSHGSLDVIYYASDIIKQISIVFSEEGYSRNKEKSGEVMKGFDSLKKLFPEDYQMSACMAAYKRSFLIENKISFIKGILYEDRFFSLRVITEAEDVIYITDKLYIRRFRADSIITSPASRKKIVDIIFGHKIEWNYIKSHKKWKDDKALTQYYVLCSMYMALQNDVGSLNDTKERREYISAFWDFWNTDFNIQIMSINELCLLLYILRKIKEDITMAESFIRTYSIYDIYQYCKKINELLIDKCREKLSVLPLRTTGCIGIYGIGQHTKCMLNMYRTMIGEIKSDLYFVVSENIDKREYYEKEIREINNLRQDTDYIIVSSKVYQKEICKKLELVGFEPSRIITVYNSNDAVDFVIISQVLLSVN